MKQAKTGAPGDGAGQHAWFGARLATGVADRSRRFVRKMGVSAHKRLPFLLPSAGPLARPLAGLDGDIQASIRIISRDPMVVYMGIGGGRPLSAVAALGRRLADRPASFLLMPTWSLEDPRTVAAIGRDTAWMSRHLPRHDVTFLCNTEEERHLLSTAGAKAIFSSHNLMISEDVFRPLPDVPVEYDAIYNARMSAMKRHDLATGIERLLHVTYSIGEMSVDAERAFVRRFGGHSPLHRFANPIVDGLPERLSPEQVNLAYNSAAVGLCLSEREGAMFASMEYLMAGLPIVNTPNHGGRDVFFEPDFCITVAPEPTAIRKAVDTLRDRHIPREEIRARTLEKVLPMRRALMDYINDLLSRHGASPAGTGDWIFPGTHVPMERKSVRDWAAELKG